MLGLSRGLVAQAQVQNDHLSICKESATDYPVGEVRRGGLGHRHCRGTQEHRECDSLSVELSAVSTTPLTPQTDGTT